MATKLLRIALILAVAFSMLNVADVVAQVVPLLDPVTQPKFVNPLPIPGRIDATGTVNNGGMIKGGSLNFNIDMREVVQPLGLYDVVGNPLFTTVWGYGNNRYGVSYPGPTFVTMKDIPIDVNWKNKLPPYNYNFPGLGGHLLPVDPTMHMAHPAGGGIPTVAHLHGGHTESASDGLPEAWFTQNFMETGPYFVKSKYHYDNDQEAGTLWYHDHALGITRLNVYAGLAGFYLLRDDNEMNLINSGVLPGDPYEVETVVQDRMFTADGQLYLPAQLEAEPGFDPFPPMTPSIVAEFFGDFILVNGAPWPKLDVEPRKYRFRYLNGSDSRFYVFEFQNADGVAQEFLQIGTDDGFLVTPVPLTRLLLAPGERADLVMDFSGQTEITVKNFGPDEPFKGFAVNQAPSDPATTGLVMQYVVNQPLDANVPNASVDVGTVLRPDILPLTQTGATRSLVLFEGLDNYGRLQPLLGTLANGSLTWFEPITENPMLNDVETWEVYNATEDAHPIHLHLVAFQIINRESYTGFVDEKPQIQHDGTFGIGGILTVTGLGGDARDPEPNEMGWKDTAVMLPGEVTRVIAKFDREGRYVWHCHILSHEDHEMMRPYQVGPIPPAPPAHALVLDNFKESTPSTFALKQNYPNPFTTGAEIGFEIPAAGNVEITVYNAAGQRVRSLANNEMPAGVHSVSWNGKDTAGNLLPSGVYFYKLHSGSFTQTKKMVMLR